MRRNLNLIENILAIVRNNQEEYSSLNELVNECSEDYTEAEVQQHLPLCCDAGFLIMDDPGRIAYRLTWKGHQAAESPATMIYGKN